MLFTLLKYNHDKTYTFFHATCGPLECTFIDKNQNPSGNYSLMFNSINRVHKANDIGEKQRIYENGGEIVYDERDYRIFAKG